MSTNLVNFSNNRNSEINCSTGNDYNYRKYDSCPDNNRLTRLTDDPCAVDCRSYTSQKPIKFITTNFHNLGCDPKSLCYPGYLPKDGNGWAQCKMDTDSELRQSKLTQLRFKQQQKSLPVATVPFMGRGCLNTDIESNLWGVDTYADKPCQPKDTRFHDRHFSHFESLCFNPNAVKNTVWPGNQSGVDTRHQRKENYSSGLGNVGPNNVNPRNPAAFAKYSQVSGKLGVFGPDNNTSYNPSEYQGNYSHLNISGYNPRLESLQGYEPNSCKRR